MLKLDALSQLSQLKKEIKASRNILSGTVKGSAFKFGFMALPTGKDIYLPADEMQKVIPGDQIEIELKKGEKNKNIVHIERLLESKTKIFHGKYITRGKAHFVDPDIPGMARWIFIPPNQRGKAKAKDLVKCRLTQHPFRTGNAQANIIEIVGSENTPGIEWTYAISKHGLRTEWNDKVEAELNKIDESLIELKKKGREDLTHLPFLTIDANSTIDMDDALWATKSEKGWTLNVAIADPSALIERESAIDQECIRRATSVYLPGQHIAMLPDKLSSNLCSLCAGHDRLVKVVKIEIKSSGELGSYKIADAYIRSRKKMTYGEVSALLSEVEKPGKDEKIDDELLAVLESLCSMTTAIFLWRKKNALIHAGRKEFYLELGQDKKIKSIKERHSTRAHQIVEECMVAANRCVADLLEKETVPSIFVGHKGVRADRMEQLQKIVEDRLPASSSNKLDELQGFSKIVRYLSDNEEHKPVHSLIFRQLEKSHFELAASPHFGMGFSQYTTFTSPLRKANDYLVHRQIGEILNEKPVSPVHAEQLDALVSTWQEAHGAAFDVEQWLKCQYIVQQTGNFEAVITRVFSSGFQVRLEENGIEGFISTKDMPGKISFNQNLLVLTGPNSSYELDKIIEVHLKQVDWSRKQIQFAVSA